MISFKGSDRSQTMLMPYDMSEWLPGDHLARFVIDITDRMDFSGIYARYTGKGKQPYDPKLLVSLLFYSYSTVEYCIYICLMTQVTSSHEISQVR